MSSGLLVALEMGVVIVVVFGWAGWELLQLRRARRGKDGGADREPPA